MDDDLVLLRNFEPVYILHDFVQIYTEMASENVTPPSLELQFFDDEDSVLFFQHRIFFAMHDQTSEKSNLSEVLNPLLWYFHHI